jgi:hypothetical protein
MKWRKKEKRTLGGLFAFAYASGVTLFLFSHWIRVSSAVGEQHHAFEKNLRFFHSTLTYVLVFCLGYLWKAHILPGLRVQKRVNSGLVTLSVLIFLWITALGILYLGDLDWNARVAWVHGIVGILLPATIFFHSRTRKYQE